MELLKNRFLQTHVGYFFGPDSTPITSTGKPDWDTFLIFIINQGTDIIDYYTIYDMIKDVPVEMKSLYAKHIQSLEKSLNVKPRHPKLTMPQGSTSPEIRLQNAMAYYLKCEENVRECNKTILDAIDKAIIDGDPGQKLVSHIRSSIPMELTDEEIEAVIVYVSGPDNITFRKNTLLALKVLNRFARENEIRFEDAVAVFIDLLN